MLKTKLGLSIILNLPKYDTPWWFPWQFFQRNTVKMSSLPFDFGIITAIGFVLSTISTRTVHGKGQRTDMCADRQPTWPKSPTDSS